MSSNPSYALPTAAPRPRMSAGTAAQADAQAHSAPLDGSSVPSAGSGIAVPTASKGVFSGVPAWGPPV
jgi:hypothetical protein